MKIQHRTEEELKEFIWNKCTVKECAKTFMKATQTEKGMKLEPCQCFQELVRTGKYDSANIPEEFWNFSVNDVEEGFDITILKDYQFFADNVGLSLKNKSQFLLWGLQGRGKTTISLLMLKTVLDAGYSGKILKAYDIVGLMYNNELDEIEDLDFLVVDELDKMRSEKQIFDITGIIADLMDKMSIVFISNSNIDELRNKIHFPEHFIDRLIASYQIEFKGNNYRQSFVSKFEALKQTKNAQ